MAKNRAKRLNSINSANIPIAKNSEVLNVLESAGNSSKTSMAAKGNPITPANAKKHIALEHLYIIKEYIDKGDMNGGGSGGVDGDLASAEIASDSEVNDLFRIN